MVTEQLQRHWNQDNLDVLILIVLDYGHWGRSGHAERRQVCRLNPYCFGLWSLSLLKDLGTDAVKVLILIVLDYGHWVKPLMRFLKLVSVLILIVLDYGHWERKKMERIPASSLNPYCFGLWSLSSATQLYHNLHTVLILIVLDYGHWVILLLLYYLNLMS